MKRFLKYWAIRLLGREFMALPVRAKLVGLWWCLSLVLICGWGETNPLWSHLLVIANLIASTWAVLHQLDFGIYSDNSACKKRAAQFEPPSPKT